VIDRDNRYDSLPTVKAEAGGVTGAVRVRVRVRKRERRWRGVREVLERC
jgi:hypothetical protein